MSTKQKDEKHVVYSVKVSPVQAAVLDKICETIGVNSYQMFQMFAYTMARAAAPQHELDPRIRKVMTIMETDASWAKAFNLANPNDLDVAQVVLILQQKDKRGFGAVMIDRPFMGEARMTECTDDILERVCEVTMHGIYRRLRLMGGQLGCNNLSDVLLTMIDAQTVIELEEENRIQMNGEAQFSESGRRIEYGKRTKAKHHRTPDGEAMRQQRIVFTDEDATTIDTPDDRPYGEKADEYMKTLEEQAKAEEADDMEKDMGFKPFGQEW